ncbi:MAG: DUF3551 domain-containing protein [Xanthobacteraceae bacterium]|nr:DUF3551 domain-containing protein [Xanthobacteraceae bacterium]QYK46114.1 MAG: DUF3551 domain-containing protein [Xanthobacteraceae bacterium]
MRHRLIASSLLLPLLLTGAPVQAQYPAPSQYCMDTSFRNTGTIPVCRYASLAQCEAARVRQTERCFPNPFASKEPRRGQR